MNVLKVILIVLFFILASCSNKKDANLIRERIYNRHTELHKVYKMINPNVVMLGNSITAGVNWPELLNREKIANRGISHDITENMLKRIDDVISLKPKYCFIMAGINDIYDDISVDTIFANYSEIVNRLIENNIKPVIQSTLYVSPMWKKFETKNRKVDQLNLLIKNLADKKSLIYLDVNEILSDGTNMIDENTFDGVHLTAKGYERWGVLVNHTLTKLSL